jgi:hypothetical protein
MLTQIVRRRADQVPDILNKQEIQLVQIPSLKCLLHHCRLKVAECASGELLYRGFTPRQTYGIVFGGQIPDQGCHAVARLQLRKGLL